MPTSPRTLPFSAFILENNYADKAYWEAHFAEEIEVIKKSLLDGIATQAFSERLFKLQGIIGKNTLAIWVYQQSIRELQGLLKADPALQAKYAPTLSELFKTFKKELEAQPDFTLENFQAELDDLLPKLRQGEIEAELFLKVIRSYQSIISAPFYQKIHALLNPTFIKHYFKWNSDENGERVINLLSNADYHQLYERLGQCFAEEEQRLELASRASEATLSGVPSENTTSKSASIDSPSPDSKPSYRYLNRLFNQAVSTVKGAAQYVLNNPGKAITAGLAAQVTAVAALEGMRLSNKNPASSTELSKDVKRLENSLARASEVASIDLARRQALSHPALEKIKTKETKASITTQKRTVSPRVKRAVGDEFPVATTHSQQQPAVTILNNGNALVTWMSSGQDGSNNGIYGQIVDATGSKVGSEFQVNTYTTDNQWYPAVTALSNGNALVTWMSYLQDGSNNGIYGQIVDATGSKVGGEFRVNTYTLADQSYPAVTTLSNGNALVTWKSSPNQDGDGWGIYGQIVDAMGSKVGSEFQVNTYTTSHQQFSAVTALNNGNVLVTWQSYGQDGSGEGVYGQMFTASGTKVGSEFQVNTYMANNQAYPAVTVLSNGNVLVTWESLGQDGDGYGIYGQVVDATGSKVGSEFPINTYTANDQAYPAATALSNGHALITWQSNGQDGDDYGTYAQIVDDTGRKVGREFQVNTYTESYQQFPAVTTFNNGNALVTWESNNQGGSSPGIYGKIIDTHLTATSTNQAINYSKNTPYNLLDIVITPPVFISNATVTLTLSNPLAGSLTTATLGGVTSTYNAMTGQWQAIGDVADINALLAGLQFVPTTNYQGNFAIAINIDDGFNVPFTNSMQMIGDEFQINTYTTSNQSGSAVTALSNGNALVTWTSYLQDGSGYGVYGQVVDATGSKVGSEFQVNTYTTSDQSDPVVTVLSNGNALVTWNSYGQDSDNDGIYGQIVDATGSKVGSEFQVNTYTTSQQNYPAVTALNNGNVLVTWMSLGQDGDSTGIYGQIVNANGNKVGTEFRVNTYTTSYQLNPAVTALNDGNALVTWYSASQDGDGSGIYAQIVDASGNKVGSEFRVNTYTIGNQFFPAVTALDSGNALVVWMSDGQDGSSYGIYAQIIDVTGNKVGSEFRVNTYTTSTQAYPAVAALNNGNALVTWHTASQDGSSYGIYAQVVDATGRKVGSEFQVNTYTTNDQSYPAVAALNDGNALVTWESNGQDGDGYGIFGKIIDTHLTATNTNQAINYVENTPQDLANIIITPPLFISNITCSLTLSDPLAGSLTTSTSGNATSTYTPNTGIWQVSGNVTDVNALLANVQFQPALNYASNFTLSVLIDDQFNTPLADTMALVGYPTPALTTDSFTTQESTTQRVTTGPVTTASQSQGTSGATTNNVTSQSLTSESASTTQESTTQKVTTSPASTTSQNPDPVTSATSNAVTSHSLASESVSTTSTEEVSSSQPHSNIGIIVGGVLGGLAALATATGLGIFATRRQRQKERVNTALNEEEMQPVSHSAYVNIPGKAERQSPADEEEIRPSPSSAPDSDYAAIPGKAEPHHRVLTGTINGIRFELLPHIDNAPLKEELYAEYGLRKSGKSTLGKGAFGKVSLARRLDTGDIVAVKKIFGEEKIKETEQETDMQRQVRHSANVGQFIDEIITPNKKGMLTRYQFSKLGGRGDGASLVKRAATLQDPIQKAALVQFVMTQLLDAVISIHTRNIYHLDIKPDNMLMDKDFKLQLIDFGRAYTAKDGKPILQGVSLGACHYWPPEGANYYRTAHELSNQSGPVLSIDAKKCDSWMVGMTIAELLLGRFPWSLNKVMRGNEGEGKPSYSRVMKKWDDDFYQTQLNKFQRELSNYGIVGKTVAGLLQFDPQQRLSVSKALKQLNLTPLSEDSEQNVKQTLQTIYRQSTTTDNNSTAMQQTAYKEISEVPESGIATEDKDTVMEESSENAPRFG